MECIIKYAALHHPIGVNTIHQHEIEVTDTKLPDGWKNTHTGMYLVACHIATRLLAFLNVSETQQIEIAESNADFEAVLLIQVCVGYAMGMFVQSMPDAEKQALALHLIQAYEVRIRNYQPQLHIKKQGSSGDIIFSFVPISDPINVLTWKLTEQQFITCICILITRCSHLPQKGMVGENEMAVGEALDTGSRIIETVIPLRYTLDQLHHMRTQQKKVQVRERTQDPEGNRVIREVVEGVSSIPVDNDTWLDIYAGLNNMHTTLLVYDVLIGENLTVDLLSKDATYEGEKARICDSNELAQWLSQKYAKIEQDGAHTSQANTFELFLGVFFGINRAFITRNSIPLAFFSDSCTGPDPDIRLIPPITRFTCGVIQFTLKNTQGTLQHSQFSSVSAHLRFPKGSTTNVLTPQYDPGDTGVNPFFTPRNEHPKRTRDASMHGEAYDQHAQCICQCRDMVAKQNLFIQRIATAFHDSLMITSADKMLIMDDLLSSIKIIINEWYAEWNQFDWSLFTQADENIELLINNIKKNVNQMVDSSPDKTYPFVHILMYFGTLLMCMDKHGITIDEYSFDDLMQLIVHIPFKAVLMPHRNIHTPLDKTLLEVIMKSFAHFQNDSYKFSLLKIAAVLASWEIIYNIERANPHLPSNLQQNLDKFIVKMILDYIFSDRYDSADPDMDDHVAEEVKNNKPEIIKTFNILHAAHVTKTFGVKCFPTMAADGSLILISLYDWYCVSITDKSTPRKNYTPPILKHAGLNTKKGNDKGFANKKK